MQCKRWRGKVGENVVREFYGTLHHEKAHKGTIVTTGYFTKAAQAWARGKPISLYDGQQLVELWRKAKRQLQ